MRGQNVEVLSHAHDSTLPLLEGNYFRPISDETRARFNSWDAISIHQPRFESEFDFSLPNLTVESRPRLFSAALTIEEPESSSKGLGQSHCKGRVIEIDQFWFETETKTIPKEARSPAKALSGSELRIPRTYRSEAERLSLKVANVARFWSTEYPIIPNVFRFAKIDEGDNDNFHEFLEISKKHLMVQAFKDSKHKNENSIH